MWSQCPSAWQFKSSDARDIKPKDLDSAFETVCLYEEVEFPPGDAVRPATTAGFKALDTFWAAMCRRLPKKITEDTTCKTQKKARGFYGQMRIASSRRSRPGTLAGLLATWDFTPGITQCRWSTDAALGRLFLLLSGLLYFTGGTHNPFSILYVVHIVMAVVVLGTAWTWLIAAMFAAIIAALRGAFQRIGARADKRRNH